MTHIFLIGPRASGKTTLGKMLAYTLNLPFLDTDEKVERESGQPIAEIVKQGGWDRFRALETKVLRKVCTREPHVVATGGGIVLREENRELLKKHGVTLYLKADVEELIARLTAAPLPGQRPALTDKSAEDEVRQVVAEREPIYAAAANITLDAGQAQDPLARKALDAVKSAAQ